MFSITQQAAAYAGWNQQHQPPPPDSRRPKPKEKIDEEEVTDAKTFISLVEKEHAKMLTEVCMVMISKLSSDDDFLYRNNVEILTEVCLVVVRVVRAC